MQEFTTVFEIAAGTNGIRHDAWMRLIIGVAILFAGLVGFIMRRRTKGQFPKRLYTPIFMTGWGILWLLMHIPMFHTAFSEVDRLVEIYRRGGSQIVEGPIHVLHKQPREGHSEGDRIAVGEREFEINYFFQTPGYKETISHGGALREGVRARLHHHDGVILKVEVELAKP